MAMKKTSESEEQIGFAPRPTESGASVDDVCCTLGVGAATFHLEKKLEGMGVAESRRLEQPVAGLSLDRKLFQVLLAKTLRPASRRERAGKAQAAFRVSERREPARSPDRGERGSASWAARATRGKDSRIAWNSSS
jgi:putative transposase